MIAVFLLAFVMMLFMPAICRACTTVLVGKNISTTGHVIVGHDEDDGGCLINRHGYVPAAAHKEGETLPAEEGYAKIPQVPRTNGFYWSEIKGAKGGLTAADCMINDHGVFIGSDSCYPSKADTADASRLSDGGIGYNLRRILAERAGTAREAVEMAARLICRYGYVPSGRSYVIADADEAWLLQIVSGRNYAAQRVPDDGAAFLPNYYTIHDIHPEDTENFLVSPGLVEYAISSGWYDPAQGGFDFAEAFQQDSTRFAPGNRFRSAGGYSILLGHSFWRDGSYPFSVKPERKVSPEQVMEVLRCHYEGTVADAPYLKGSVPGGAPHDTDLRRICVGTTLEGAVAVFGPRERPEALTLWISPGRPCELPFMPVHPLLGLPDVLDGMKDRSAQLLEDHLKPEHGILDRREGDYQALRDFQDMFEQVYDEHHDAHCRWLWAYEATLFSGENRLQERLRSLYESGKDEEAEACAREADENCVSRTVALLKEHMEDLEPVTVTASSGSSENGTAITELSFDIGSRIPMDGSLIISMSGTTSRLSVRPIPGTLMPKGGSWTTLIETDKLNIPSDEGLFTLWLCGRDTKGRPFGGKFLFEGHAKPEPQM